MNCVYNGAITFNTTSAQSGTSFLESGAQQINANPFRCSTDCQFPKPQVCNPTYNFRVGTAGMRPDEATCCKHCDTICGSRQVLWEYRVCVHGCRAYCPFTAGDWKDWGGLGQAGR